MDEVNNPAAVHKQCVGLNECPGAKGHKQYRWKGDKWNKAVILVLDNKVDILLCMSLSTKNVLKNRNYENVFSTEKKEEKKNRREESIITEYCVRSVKVRNRIKRRNV